MEFQYIYCPACGVKLKIPQNCGELKVRCTKCNHKFIHNGGFKRPPKHESNPKIPKMGWRGVVGIILYIIAALGFIAAIASKAKSSELLAAGAFAFGGLYFRVQDRKRRGKTPKGFGYKTNGSKSQAKDTKSRETIFFILGIVAYVIAIYFLVYEDSFVFAVILAVAGFILHQIKNRMKFKRTGEKKDPPRWLAKLKNDLVGQPGRCVDCKYCCKNSSRQYSDTDYFCRLSKCENITEETRSNCVEKPKITEADINNLFSEVDIWTPAGKEYIRRSLVGETMSWNDIDQFLTKLPKEHPEYIDHSKTAKYNNI